jgi:LytS/YehU family sensor histidine kinase
VVGKALGSGPALGQAFLPIQLPVLLAGLLAGPFVGALSGLFSPLVSYAATGMPMAAILPFMTIELVGYGVTAGLLKGAKLPVIGKVLMVQVVGRLLRAGAVIFAVLVLGNHSITTADSWNSIVAGLPGIVLQLCLLPLIVSRLERLKAH